MNFWAVVGAVVLGMVLFFVGLGVLYLALNGVLYLLENKIIEETKYSPDDYGYDMDNIRNRNKE